MENTLADIGMDWILVTGMTEAYYISATTVTFAQYDEYCNATGTNKPIAEFGRGQQPVVNVSVHDAINYCQWLSKATGTTIRLPEESEWVWASRGGCKSQGNGYEYSGSDSIDDVAWYGKNSGDRTHQVGLKQPNELGIYDMSGNVWELVGHDGLICGGSYEMAAMDCAVKYSIRGKCSPDFRYGATGFRIVKEC